MLFIYVRDLTACLLLLRVLIMLHIVNLMCSALLLDDTWQVPSAPVAERQRAAAEHRANEIFGLGADGHPDDDEILEEDFDEWPDESVALRLYHPMACVHFFCCP